MGRCRRRYRRNYFFTPEIYLTGWGLVGCRWRRTSTGTWHSASATSSTIPISAVAGYRALGVNYDNDGFVFDVVQQGPIFRSPSGSSIVGVASAAARRGGGNDRGHRGFRRLPLTTRRVGA